MSNWTEADVARINASRTPIRPARMPQEPRSDVPTTQLARKGSKYRAEPCIVTQDLTLFSKEDIITAEAVSGNPLTGTGSLADRGARIGISGEWFGSLKEGRRYIDLKRLEQAGEIQDLECQPEFEIRANGIPVGLYRGDFRYRRGTYGPEVIEDVKGVRTPVYRLKKKLVESLYGITIQEL